jgi:amidophosphoribosyltransferase
MPAASELVAAGRTVEEVRQFVGADWLIYQDLKDLVDSVHHENADIESFDTSCFSGQYVTGNIDSTYLDELETLRSNAAKARRDAQIRKEETSGTRVPERGGF